MKTQRKPTPVGHIFKEWMDNTEVDYDQVRVELDMDPSAFEMFLDGVYPVTPYLCKKLAKVTGVSEEFWYNLHKNILSEQYNTNLLLRKFEEN